MPKHKIKAQLYDNVLTENPNDFIARVNAEKSLDVRAVAQSAVTRGGANISAADMEHAVNLWQKEMGYLLCDGFSVNTGWFMAAPKIRGTFDSPTEKFNSGKHAISIDIRQGIMLRKELEDVEVNITGVATVDAFIAQVKDIKTGSINDLITPNRNLRISGNKLKVAGTNPNVGIFFIDSVKPEIRVRVKAEDIVTNNPSELLIITPALGVGTWRLEVVTQFSTGNKLLKDPRTATFDRILTVM